jgi:hypothetical protein
MGSNTERLIEWCEENADCWKVHNPSTTKLEHVNMGVAIPRHMYRPARTTTSCCKWCGVCKERKHLYKLRDGPLDRWFCSDDHALEWLDYRHKTPAINAMLRVHPRERDLGGKTIDEWVRDELSHTKSKNAHTTGSGRSDGIRDLDCGQVPV